MSKKGTNLPAGRQEKDTAADYIPPAEGSLIKLGYYCKLNIGNAKS